MAEKSPEKPTVVHADLAAKDLGVPVYYSATLDVSEGNTDTGTNIEERGADVTVSHPVADPAELRRRAHITAQLAIYNRDLWDVERSPEAFDTAVIDVAERVFEAFEIDVGTLPIERPYTYAILVHDVWKIDSMPGLRQYLQDHPSTANRIGLAEVPSTASFYRRRNLLREARLRSVFAAVSECIVHAIWRSGHPLPEEIIDRWELDTTPVVTEFDISPETRDEALRNWARELLADASTALSFNRDSSRVSYSIEQYIGLLAHSTLQQVGLTRAQNTAGWVFGDAVVPGGDGLLKHITALDLDKIESQFATAHSQVFDRFAARGLFDDPIDLAFDTTEIIWWGDEMDATIGKRRPEKDATPKWVFALLVGFNSDVRVNFGAVHVRSKDRHASVLEELLSTATANAEPRYAFCDKEFYDGSVIEALRTGLGKQWVIKAQNYDSIEDFIKKTPSDEPGFIKEIEATSAKPRPNAFAIPKKLHRQQTLINFRTTDQVLDPDGSASTHTVYLTDMDDVETTPEVIKFRYDYRWNVETANRQFKRVLPNTASQNVRARIYCANIATLFINWHSLINRTLSPTYNLPLTVTRNELLTAIRDVAFTETE
ncbi:transposase [Halovivax gelatinilyticus]|uniref:transposase n=1 Tax=Halovivax gelatinilyticus TaxID=2961597 RepID=UPI0020CA5881|nr:transposase [Halovivax gelatinilyticus]